MLVTLLVLLLVVVVGGFYAYKVSGLEVPTPYGVHVVLVNEPTGDAPPAAERAALQVLEGLAEENIDDLGYPDYDRDHDRVVVNLATAAGERIFAGMTRPDGVTFFVRHHAHSVSDFDRLTTLLLERVDSIHESSVDSINDRLEVTSTSISPGVLEKVGELAGSTGVAVRWAPFEQPVTVD